LEKLSMRRSICYCDPKGATAGEHNTWHFIYTTSVALPKGTKVKFDLNSKGRDIDWQLPSATLKAGTNVIYLHLEGKKPEAVRDELKAMHGKLVAERSIEYARSDGSKWKLTVADVLARKASFEISYNPNDCAEVRWGASPGSAEHATCKRHAPADQLARMAEYRAWFAEARRPPR